MIVRMLVHVCTRVLLYMCLTDVVTRGTGNAGVLQPFYGHLHVYVDVCTHMYTHTCVCDRYYNWRRWSCWCLVAFMCMIMSVLMMFAQLCTGVSDRNVPEIHSAYCWELKPVWTQFTSDHSALWSVLH